MKKWIASIMVATMLTVSAFATFEENVANKNINFANDLSVPVWLLEECKTEPSRTMTLVAEDFEVTFKGSELGSLNSVSGYTFEYKQRTDNFGIYNHFAGYDTPKMVVNFNEEKSLPGKTTLTVRTSPFAPYTSVRVYRFEEEYKYVTITEAATVGKDGRISFTVDKGGEYLITTSDLQQKDNFYRDLNIPTAEDIINGVAPQSSSSTISMPSDIVIDKTNPTTGAVA